MRKHQCSFGKKLIIIFAIFQWAIFAPRVQAWGDAIPAAFVKQALEEAFRSIEGALLGSLKSVAMTVMNTRVMSLIGGSSAGTSQVITDWRSYLYKEAEDQAKVEVDVWADSVLEGRDTSQYAMLAKQDADLLGYGYYDRYKMLKQASDSGQLNCKADAVEKLGYDPTQKFDLKALNVLFNPDNMCANPIGFEMALEMKKTQAYAKAYEVQKIKATSSGYRGVEKNGVTVLPGSTVGQIVANTEDMGRKIIAAAENPGQLASGVIVSLTNQFVTNMIQNGIGKVQANIERDIRNIDRKISGQVREINKTLGPAARFTRELNQQTSVYVKPATNAKAAVPQYYDP